MIKLDLKEQIENYRPYNEQEENDQETIIECINTFKDVLTRENKICHFTASNWIVNKERTKVLMIYHNIYKQAPVFDKAFLLLAYQYNFTEIIPGVHFY